jgi:hypothetical protein
MYSTATGDMRALELAMAFWDAAPDSSRRR